MTTFRIIDASATDVVALGDGRDRVSDVLGEFRTFGVRRRARRQTIA